MELIETEKEYVKDLALIVEVEHARLASMRRSIMVVHLGLHECDRK